MGYLSIKAQLKKSSPLEIQVKNGLVTLVHTHVKKDEATQSEPHNPKNLRWTLPGPWAQNLKKKEMEKKKRKAPRKMVRKRKQEGA